MSLCLSFGLHLVVVKVKVRDVNMAIPIQAINSLQMGQRNTLNSHMVVNTQNIRTAGTK